LLHVTAITKRSSSVIRRHFERNVGQHGLCDIGCNQTCHKRGADFLRD